MGNRARRVDQNQAEIVRALRAVGASVYITSAVGKGYPDLSVGFRGCNYLIEVKRGDASPSKRALTGDEVTFHSGWRGSVVVVGSAAEALAAIGALEPAS